MQNELKPFLTDLLMKHTANDAVLPAEDYTFTNDFMTIGYIDGVKVEFNSDSAFNIVKEISEAMGIFDEE